MPYSTSLNPHPPTKLQIYVDRIRFSLGVVAIIAIVVTSIIGYKENNATNERITKIESPCLRYGPNSRECHESFRAAINSITDFQLCVLLQQRPDLTGVTPSDCRRIAHEARNQAKLRQEDDHSKPSSSEESSSARSPSNHLAPHTAPPTSEHPSSDGSGPHHGSSGGDQHAPSPQQPSSPPTESPAPSSQSPATSGSQAGASADQAPKPAQESPFETPPLVEVEAPGLPAQVCAQGVVSVNC